MGMLFTPLLRIQTLLYYENIDSPILRKVQLQQGLGGDFLLEIKGADGAYAFGRFTVH